MHSIDHAVAGVLTAIGTVYPLLDAKRFRSKLKSLDDSPSPRRIGIYWQLLVWLWVIAAIVMSHWLYRAYSFSDLGFELPNTLRFWIVLGVIGVFISILVTMAIGLRNSADLRARAMESMAKIDESSLVPRDCREMKYWTLCSISAASEELVFRGFFIWYLSSQFNCWVAAIGSTVLFGIAHAYQGPAGVLRSGIYGAVLAAAYLLSGSIWPAVLLHVSQDLYGGGAGYLALRYSQEKSET